MYYWCKFGQHRFRGFDTRAATDIQTDILQIPLFGAGSPESESFQQKNLFSYDHHYALSTLKIGLYVRKYNVAIS